MTKEGKAYGFFYYQGKTEDVLDELPRARNEANAPKELSLDLKDIDNLDTRGDAGLVKIVEKAKASRMSHVLSASVPGMGSRKVADELSTVMGNIYTSPLYKGEEPFCAGIVYERGGKYVFKRD